MAPDVALVRISLEPAAPYSIKVHVISSDREDGGAYHSEVWPGEGLSIAMYGLREIRVERGKDVQSQG